MECPKPYCGGYCDAGDYVTDGERGSVGNTLHKGSHINPLLGLGNLAFWGAKLAFSTAYQCRKCGHVFRKWG
jgi:hypothetical protein